MAKLKFKEKTSKDALIIDEPWKIIICDDEKEVHTITKAVLSDFVFDNRKLEFLSAYSGQEAIDIVKEHDDIAMIFLDVVMESDYAGLDVVKKIRNELKNHLIRIVLRTGQPGYAPEKKVISQYDINDYKEKTELTDVKLYTTTISALRSYKDLMSIQKSKVGLEKIIEATRNIFEKNSLELFASGVLTQLISILKLNGSSFLVCENGFSIEKDKDNYTLLAASGTYCDKNLSEIMTIEVKELFSQVLQTKESMYLDDTFIGYFESDLHKTNLIYISDCQKNSNIDKNLINIFSNNVSVAFNNLYLNKEIIDTQKELIETLGETVEKRSKEASHHVKRVATISYEIAKKIGLSEQVCDMIRSASPMHDVGKIGIPDSILLKTSSLTNDEMIIMKTHAKIGHDILAHSQKEVLKVASIIAYEHHEKWDGTGYPNAKKGEEIHIYGRISAIADVFDALLHGRCYKKAWKMTDVVEYFKEERGKHFEPVLVDILLDNLEYFKKNCE